VTLSALAVVAAGSCSRDPEIEERAVFVFSPRACPVNDSAFSVVYAEGDFEPSPTRPPTATAFLREVGRALDDLPKETRAITVDVSQNDSAWRGLSDIPKRGPINVLVWPGRDVCRLTRNVERREGGAIAVFGRHFLVTGGRSIDGSQVPNSYVGDLSTGSIERLAFGLNTRRARTTITEFRPGGPGQDGEPSAALVAGGEDPDFATILATAEIYLPNPDAPGDIGDFAPQRIDLAEPRTRHGAAVLATGETLLVGGRGPGGLLTTMEVVDPVTRRSRSSGVATLQVRRENPTVLRLANGEILVAGGLDAEGKQVATLEWFTPDASQRTKRPVDLVTGRERGFVALDGGGALAVIAPDEGVTDIRTVWVISADGVLEPATSLTGLTAAVLFPGANGAPILWTGQQWVRWAPWAGEFQPIPEGPGQGPGAGPIATSDRGLGLWLQDRGEAGMFVTGYRFATRSRYDALPKPLLVRDPTVLAPDRLTGSPGSSLQFDPATGLRLGSGASAFLADVTFADFDLSLDVTAPAPLVVLRETTGRELEVGGAACAIAQAATRSLVIKRRGTRVEVSFDGGALRSCPTELAPDVRVAVGLRGSQSVGTSAARNLQVARH
jgi:hypothetical protein